jgi:hypothetical protein
VDKEKPAEEISPGRADGTSEALSLPTFHELDRESDDQQRGHKQSHLQGCRQNGNPNGKRAEIDKCCGHEGSRRSDKDGDDQNDPFRNEKRPGISPRARVWGRLAASKQLESPKT